MGACVSCEAVGHSSSLTRHEDVLRSCRVGVCLAKSASSEIKTTRSPLDLTSERAYFAGSFTGKTFYGKARR
jgi:hypothetical protein